MTRDTFTQTATGARWLAVAFAAATVLAALAPAQAEPPARLVVQQGHTSQIEAVTFSPNGRLMASTSEDGTARLWETTTGRLVRTFGGFGDKMLTPVFDPGGDWVAFGSSTVGVRVYGLGDGVERHTIKPPQPVSSFALSPDGDHLVTGHSSSNSLEVRLWRVADGELVRTFAGGHDEVRTFGWIIDLRFERGGRKLTSMGTDGNLVTWDVASGKVLKVVGDSGLQDVVSPDRRWSLSPRALHPNPPLLSPVARPTVAHELKGHGKSVDAAAFSPDSRLAATGSNEGKVIVWKVAGRRPVQTIDGRSAPITALTFTHDNRALAVGMADGRIELWDVGGRRATSAPRVTFTGHTGRASTVAFSADGRHALVASGASAKLWDLALARPTTLFRVPSGADIYAADLSPDGKHVAVVDATGKVHLLRASGGAPVQTFDLEIDRGRALRGGVGFTKDGSLLLAGARGNWGVWRLADGKKLESGKSRKMWHVVQVFPDDNLALLPDRGLVDIDRLISDGLREATVDRMRTGDGKHTLLHGRRPLAIVPGGKIALYGSGWPSVPAVREIGGKRLHARKSGADWWRSYVTATAVTSDGAVGAVGTSNGVVELVGLPKADARHTVDVGSAVQDLAFSPDGGRLLAACEDGAIRLIDPASGELLYSATADDGGDFVSYTPQGFFFGSERGQKHFVHVVIGDRTHAIDQLFERFYDPERVRRRGLGQAPKHAPEVELARVSSPPTVTIHSPSSGSTREERIELEVELTDQGGGIGRALLYQNGKLVAEATRGFERKKGGPRATFPVLLSRGVNRFEVVAESTDRIRSAPATVTVELQGPRPKSTLHVLAIGVNAYKNPRYALNFGRPDAEAVAAALSRHGQTIFADVQLHTVFDAQVTREAIEAKFQEVIAQAEPDDVFVFYFAGHGVMSEGDAATPPSFYLVPHDVTQLYGDDAGLAARAVSADRLRAWLKSIKAQKQLVLIDACEAGGALKAFAFRGAAEEKAMYQLARSVGVVLIASTGSDQLAAEVKALGHGVFTWALLEALSGEADDGGDGKVTVKEVEAFLNDQVPELTKKHRGSPQYPHSFSVGQDFPIAVPSR